MNTKEKDEIGSYKQNFLCLIIFSSHMKCETLDMEFVGKNFRDYVFPSDIPSVERHFQEGRWKDSIKIATEMFVFSHRKR